MVEEKQLPIEAGPKNEGYPYPVKDYIDPEKAQALYNSARKGFRPTHAAVLVQEAWKLPKDVKRTASLKAIRLGTKGSILIAGAKKFQRYMSSGEEPEYLPLTYDLQNLNRDDALVMVAAVAHALKENEHEQQRAAFVKGLRRELEGAVKSAKGEDTINAREQAEALIACFEPVQEIT